ncbi:ImmA/IrrE family metallo-endopeptidase [Pseudoxanthomonas mexicana]|uniref:ImmA/IrrE family metallo-endopeptidase n=2 Tax=Pseudoxanthomonas mexicana TaxID=128785 RepID=A0ABX6RH35_PSEMX|nr:ImmA/IrrE family metallo-endopeptidase [Pseudoxanthomonas mexicana]
MQVDNGKDLWSIPLSDLVSEFEVLGDAIALRFSNEAKFFSLIKAWNERVKIDALTLLATSVGISRTNAKRLVDARLLEVPSDLNDAANDDDELRLAARVTGELAFDRLKYILDIASSLPAQKSTELDRLKRAVSNDLVQSQYQKPYDVGVRVAISARAQLGVQSNQKVDLEKILSGLNVSLRVEHCELEDDFKGLAIWGKKHGPGIIVAESSKSRFSLAYQRVTIAHELGHLLMDGDHAIGAVDILHGRVPPSMEQRAKSFAGEFLLPAKVAADAWQERGHPQDRENLKLLVEALSRKYGVTNAVAAWKLEHGLKALDVDLSAVLDVVVPGRWSPRSV